MRKFLDSITIPSVWIIAILELLLLTFCIIRFIRTKSKLTLLISFITLGLFFDAFIISLGSITDVSSLKGISQCRFILHGLLIPLILIVCVFSIDLKKPWNYIIFGLTIVFMVLGVIEGSLTKIVLKEGVLPRFKVSDDNPRWISTITNILNYGTIFPLVGVGIYTWIKQKNPFLFIAGISMLLFTILGIIMNIVTKEGDVKGDYMFFISMYGEILMVIFMQIYTIKKEEKFI